VLFPALLIETLARADLSAVPIVGVAARWLSSVVIMARCASRCGRCLRARSG